MARPFSSATAEQVVTAVEAVVVSHEPADAGLVAAFSDIPRIQAEGALKLAADMGLLAENGNIYTPASPLCQFVVTPNQLQKAAVLRLVLEAYQPFILFRNRLTATNRVDTAAQQTQAVLDLDAHREEIKDTLIGLGTYSQALATQGGGHYRLEDNPAGNTMEVMVQACKDVAAAEARVREQLGTEVADSVDRVEVLLPLSRSLLYAESGDGREAVLNAGNAIESYLDSLGTGSGVNLAGASGVNAKLERFSQAGKLPKKLIHVGKYLGHVRNAADHGVDPDLGASWDIRGTTGIEYGFVACSFIATTTGHVSGKSPQI